MRCSIGIPKVMLSLKIGPFLSNSRSCTLYGFVKRSDLTKNSTNDFKRFGGPGMSSKDRTKFISASDFAESGVWLSSSDGIALVFWNLRKTAKGFKCWDLGRFLLNLLEKAYMFSNLGHERPYSKSGLASKLCQFLLVPVSHRHFPKVILQTGLNNVCACARSHGSRWR